MAELSVFGVGVCTADPELRTVGENKTSVCSVNVAFNRSFKNKEDEWQNEPCFLRTQVWGARAKRMADLVRKGQPIYICGYMKQDTWDDNGKKRISYSITLKDFQLCERNGKKKAEQQPVSTPSDSGGSSAGDDSDIPF